MTNSPEVAKELQKKCGGRHVRVHLTGKGHPGHNDIRADSAQPHVRDSDNRNWWSTLEFNACYPCATMVMWEKNLGDQKCGSPEEEQNTKKTNS